MGLGEQEAASEAENVTASEAETVTVRETVKIQAVGAIKSTMTQMINHSTEDNRMALNAHSSTRNGEKPKIGGIKAENETMELEMISGGTDVTKVKKKRKKKEMINHLSKKAL